MLFFPVHGRHYDRQCGGINPIVSRWYRWSGFCDLLFAVGGRMYSGGGRDIAQYIGYYLRESFRRGILVFSNDTEVMSLCFSKNKLMPELLSSCGLAMLFVYGGLAEKLALLLKCPSAASASWIRCRFGVLSISDFRSLNFKQWKICPKRDMLYHQEFGQRR